MQIVTPNRMRGVVSALSVIMYSGVGLGVAPTLVAVASDYVFDARIRVALGVVVHLERRHRGMPGLQPPACLLRKPQKPKRMRRYIRRVNPDELGQGTSARMAFITGANRGIGAAVALALARRGIGSVLAVRVAESAHSVAQAVKELGAPCFIEPCDVAQPDSVKGAVGNALRRAGRLDILVNNAGQIRAHRPYWRRFARGLAARGDGQPGRRLQRDACLPAGTHREARRLSSTSRPAPPTRRARDGRLTAVPKPPWR